MILWVDGADPDWQTEKARCSPPGGEDGDSENRYRDWGLLPYWFRGIERFAPWARRIHFVTWGHVPGFLNMNAPKLHVVRHEDFIPSEFLPTFNSHTIELNIHRIPGLAEHFVYFNDDMFLLRPAAQTDFFQDGLPCTCGREEPWVFRGKVGIWSHAAANDLGIINRHFSKREAVKAHGKTYRHGRWQDALCTLALERLFPDAFTGFPNLHAPNPYRKQTFEEVWEAEPELLRQTCFHRFRARSDVNQWLCLWWQVASGAFRPCEVDNLVLDASQENIGLICDAIVGQKHTFLCVNDPGGDAEASAAGLRGAFEKLLPEKSGFEL